MNNTGSRHAPEEVLALRDVGKLLQPLAGRAGTRDFGRQIRAAPAEPLTEFAARAKAAWARLIRKVYEADPLECPKCKGPMRVIALIEDAHVVRRILERLGLWAPAPSERSPPIGHEAWPTYVSLPLTYHPGPDIA